MENPLARFFKGGYAGQRNSFTKQLKRTPENLIEVEIGDTKQDDFYPQMKLKRWDNEVNLSVRLIHDTPDKETFSNKNGKILWNKGKVGARFYEMPTDDINTDGAYEFEVLLNEKPETNMVEFSIQTKELDFFYQPALTPEEVAEGHIRPDNIVGSYAVYHKTQRGNYSDKHYQTGKAFHIYRPEIIDAKDNRVWGELFVDVEREKVVITVPQEFLDNATYPVIVDPTFGNTAIGGSTAGLGLNRYLMNKQTLAVNAATIDSIATYGQSNSGTIGIDVLYYTDLVGVPVTRRNVRQSSVGTTLQWNTITFSSPIAESAADFWLGMIFSNTYNYNYDATGGTSIDTFVNSSYSNQGSDPYNGSGGGGTKLVSIYANYTAAAVVKKTRMMMGM